MLDRGPSLVGVGEAATYFQVSSGRMPAAENGAQIQRKEPVFNAEETDALAAYIQANGGGPVIPDGDLRSTDRDLPRRRAVPAELRVLPQLHRPGRRALAGQVRAQPRPGDGPADLRRHAQRPAEHAEVR